MAPFRSSPGKPTKRRCATSCFQSGSNILRLHGAHDETQPRLDPPKGARSGGRLGSRSRRGRRRGSSHAARASHRTAQVLAVLRARRGSRRQYEMVSRTWSRSGTTATRSRSSSCMSPTTPTWTAPSCRPLSLSGAVPDLFIISPGDFLRYYNGGVLLDLTPFMEKARATISPRGDPRATAWSTARSTASPGGRADGDVLQRRRLRTRSGSPTRTFPRLGRTFSPSAKKLTNEKRFGVLFETNPGYYQNFTWYPFLWQGGGDFQDHGRQERVQLARRGAGAQVLAGRHQHGRRAAEAPRRRRLGRSAQSRLRLLRDAERRHLGDRAIARGQRPTSSTASSSCPRLPAANTSPSAAAGRSSPTPRKESEGRRRVLSPGRWVR